MNEFLNFLQQYKLYWIMKQLIYIGYKRRGKKLDKVIYNEALKVWIFSLDGFHFVNKGPGWVQDFDYLLDNLKKYSAHHYLPKEGDCVIDLGAGIGEETLILSKLVGPRGEVFAIEAQPSTASILKHACDINNLKNVHVDNIAIADTNGQVAIEDDDDGYLKNTVGDISGTGHNGVQVDARTFDHFVEKRKITKIDFLKVNIEGAEQLMIKGMEQSIVMVKNIAVSCHDFRWISGESEFYKTHDKVLAFLKEHNFHVIERQTGNVVIDSYLYGIKK